MNSRLFNLINNSFFLVPLFIVFFVLVADGQEPIRIKDEQILVTSKLPSKETEIGRQVTIIRREDFHQFPVKSLAELLRYACGLDFQERGPHGLQADLSLRGSTFQQVLILIDGIRVNDLQTAHHNMDIPIPLESIERIEILHGHGSSLYGADAVGGVINIVTRKPERTSFAGKIGYYDYRTFYGSSGIGIKKGNFSNSFSLQTNSSRGFMEGRDFNNFSLFEKIFFSLPSGYLEILFSHGKKNFGAYDFYTPGMNFSSREMTRTDFLAASFDWKYRSFFFTHKVFFRSHFDRFVLDQKRPNFYTNETTNKNFGAYFVLRRENFAAGFELAKELFDSLKAGNHSNFRFAGFLEIRKTIGQRMIFDLGVREDFHQTYDWTFSPDLTLTYLLSSRVKIRTSAGLSFRAPSYTELYYQDPVNVGNPNLKPERGISYEIGVDSYFRNFELKWSLLARREKNLIDWISRGKKWYAENIRQRGLRGMEFEARKIFRFFHFVIKSSFFALSEKESPHIYKYGYKIPQRQINIAWSLKPFSSLSLDSHFVYKKRMKELSYYLWDLRISKKIGPVDIFFEGTNLTNTKYEDIKGVPMPGRWIGGGIQWKI